MKIRHHFSLARLNSGRPLVFLVLAIWFWANAIAGILGLSRGLFNLIGAVYLVNTLILPGALLAFALALLVLNQQPRLPALLMAALALALLGVHGYATYYEPYNLQEPRIVIETARLDAPLTVVHVTDIQTNHVGAYEERVFARIQAASPDLVLFTGDLLQGLGPAAAERETGKLRALFNRLEAPLGIYAVPGNVDGRYGGQREEALGPLQWLHNQTRTLSFEGGAIQLLGLSYPQSQRGARTVIEAWMNEGEQNPLIIAMGHSPNYVLEITDLPIDLCLAGHTHGGQICMPGFGPLLTLSRVPRAWAGGFHEIENTRLNTSRGVGVERAEWLPPIRFFCPPDITRFEFQPAKE